MSLLKKLFKSASQEIENTEVELHEVTDQENILRELEAHDINSKISTALLKNNVDSTLNEQERTILHHKEALQKRIKEATDLEIEMSEYIPFIEDNSRRIVKFKKEIKDNKRRISRLRDEVESRNKIIIKQEVAFENYENTLSAQYKSITGMERNLLTSNKVIKQESDDLLSIHIQIKDNINRLDTMDKVLQEMKQKELDLEKECNDYTTVVSQQTAEFSVVEDKIARTKERNRTIKGYIKINAELVEKNHAKVKFSKDEVGRINEENGKLEATILKLKNDLDQSSDILDDYSDHITRQNVIIPEKVYEIKRLKDKLRKVKLNYAKHEAVINGNETTLQDQEEEISALNNEIESRELEIKRKKRTINEIRSLENRKELLRNSLISTNESLIGRTPTIDS